VQVLLENYLLPRSKYFSSFDQGNQQQSAVAEVDQTFSTRNSSVTCLLKLEEQKKKIQEREKYWTGKRRTRKRNIEKLGKKNFLLIKPMNLIHGATST